MSREMIELKEKFGRLVSGETRSTKPIVAANRLGHRTTEIIKRSTHYLAANPLSQTFSSIRTAAKDNSRNVPKYDSA